MNWSSAPDVVDEDIDIEGDSITDDALAEGLVADLRLLMVGEVQILNTEIIEERHKRTPSTAGPASGSSPGPRHRYPESSAGLPAYITSRKYLSMCGWVPSRSVTP
jgi:hypothetical protein